MLSRSEASLGRRFAAAQGVEGEVDSNHVSFLHREFRPETFRGEDRQVLVGAPPVYLPSGQAPST